jgi:hypothetical protein
MMLRRPPCSSDLSPLGLFLSPFWRPRRRGCGRDCGAVSTRYLLSSGSCAGGRPPSLVVAPVHRLVATEKTKRRGDKHVLGLGFTS